MSLTVRCYLCRKPVLKSAAVGLNGRWLHVGCFTDGLKKEVAPLKSALARARAEGG